MIKWTLFANVAGRVSVSVSILAAQFAQSVSCGVADSSLKCSPDQLLTACRFPAVIFVGLLCLPVSSMAASIDAEHDIESIAMKEWKDIVNEELIYVFREHFGERKLSKFRPRICVLMTYKNVEKKTHDRIEEIIARFEKTSNLQEYGYSITSSLPPDDCPDGNLVLGVYTDSAGEDKFFDRLEKHLPSLAKSGLWETFKKSSSCSSVIYRKGPAPKSIGLGVAKIDLREEEQGRTLAMCLGHALLGALGAMGNTERHFLLMGFSRDMVRKLSTTFIDVLYHPKMPYGAFRYAEREPLILEILNEVRPAGCGSDTCADR